MRRLFWGGLLAVLLVACSTGGPEVPGAATFVFSVDPVAGTVERLPGSGVSKNRVSTNRASANEASPARVLKPQELVVASSSFVFLPGNVLSLSLTFKNASECTYSQLKFSRGADTSGIVSSSEPEPGAALKPGETTGSLEFGVTHTGKPFTYSVVAQADVACAQEPNADLQVTLDEQFGDPVALGETVKYNAQVTNNGADAAAGVKLTVTVPFPLSAPGCSLSGKTLTCDLGALGAKASKEVLISGPAAAEGSFSVVAAVSSSTNDPKSSNDSATQTFQVVAATGTCTNPVNIPDLVLKKAVRNALKKPTGDLTCADMAKLTQLSANANVEDEGNPELITSLEGLQFAVNLTTLSLNDNGAISDLGPLSGLTKLTELNLISNSISDLSPLSSLTSLTRLTLNYNAVADLKPLAALTGLQDLELAVNLVTDVSPLRDLTKLYILDLYFNEITTISALVANQGLGDESDFVDLAKNCLDARALQDAAAIDARSPNNDVRFNRQGGEQCNP